MFLHPSKLTASGFKDPDLTSPITSVGNCIDFSEAMTDLQQCKSERNQSQLQFSAMITYRFRATDRKICAETVLLMSLQIRNFWWRSLDTVSPAWQVKLALLSGEIWILILVVTSSGQNLVGQASPRKKMFWRNQICWWNLITLAPYSVLGSNVFNTEENAPWHQYWEQLHVLILHNAYPFSFGVWHFIKIRRGNHVIYRQKMFQNNIK